MKAKKKKTLSDYKKDAWDAFSIYIRLRDAFATTGTPDRVVCCTCNKQYPAFGKGCVQAGHYVPGRLNAVLFEENGVHGQCYTCNDIFKGRPIEYRIFMDKKYGAPERERIEALRHNIVQYSIGDYVLIREKYEQKTKELRENKCLKTG